jgi:hypothetical protein
MPVRLESQGSLGCLRGTGHVHRHQEDDHVLDWDSRRDWRVLTGILGEYRDLNRAGLAPQGHLLLILMTSVYTTASATSAT